MERIVCFSDEVYLTTSDSHSIIDAYNKRINSFRSILIQDNVWLCKRVMILKGSNIGNHTCVAAGSIVTGKIHSNSIYAGNPVKEIKDNITWRRERI